MAEEIIIKIPKEDIVKGITTKGILARRYEFGDYVVTVKVLHKDYGKEPARARRFKRLSRWGRKSLSGRRRRSIQKGPRPRQLGHDK